MGMLAVFLMLMFDASASSVDQTNFERALAKAHQMEATLSEAEQANLFQAQGSSLLTHSVAVLTKPVLHQKSLRLLLNCKLMAL